jgi:Tfp pilus assembly protein PilV
MDQIRIKIAACKSQLASRAGGFTITEVVVASALLTAAMVPILKGLTAAHLNTVAIEHKSRSLILAQAKLDEIKARSIYHYSSSFVEDNNSIDGYPGYLRNVADNAADPLRTITVSVGYDANVDNVLGSDEIGVTLSTKLARRWNSG